ncbi:MAG: hypothetical protein M1814_004994 [Vezdaea aestivalis]|nr:MAG: hypothetical protein M1814_004994 [Vezdaea aestivalis]
MSLRLRTPGKVAGAPTTEDILYQLAHREDDRSHMAMAVNVGLFVLAATAVVLRFVSRYLNGAQMKRDDYTMLAALVFSLGLFIGGDIAILYGYGKHSVAIGLPKVIKVLQESMAWGIIYVLCSYSVKLSIVFLYQRIFVAYAKFQRWLWVYAGMASLFALAGILMEIFNCTPVKKSWEVTLPYGHCLQPLPALMSMASINIIYDLILFAMPIPLIWQLRVSRRRKVAVCFIFLLGLLACVASAFRVYYISVAVFGGDPTWRSVPLGIWSLIEVDVGILCACLPILRPLLRRLKPTCLAQSLRTQTLSTSKTKTKRSKYKSQPNMSNRLASTISWPGRRMEALLNPPSTLSPHTSYYSWNSGPTPTSFLSVSPSPPSTPKSPTHPPPLSISQPANSFTAPRPVPRPLRPFVAGENRFTLWRRLHPLDEEVTSPVAGRCAVELSVPRRAWQNPNSGSGSRPGMRGGAIVSVPPPVPDKDWVAGRGVRETSDVEWAAGGGNRF